MPNTLTAPTQSAPAIASRLNGAAVPLLAVAISIVLLGGVIAAGRTSPLPTTIPALAASAEGPPVPARTFIEQPPAAKPVTIDIPRLEVSAPVDELGLQENGEMAVPEDFSRTGWYNGLEAPGEVGTAVIVGHLDSYTGPAVFFRATELVAGDEILVTRADESVVRFVVERAEQYDKNKFPTIAVYAPTDRPTLRLITCGGDFDKKSRNYTDNVVVYATAQEA